MPIHATQLRTWAMVALLLSEDGRWINGQVMHVNGGALMP